MKRYFTASIGVVLFPDQADSVEASLIAAADEALYEAKCAGRDRVWWFAEA